MVACKAWIIQTIVRDIVNYRVSSKMRMKEVKRWKEEQYVQLEDRIFIHDREKEAEKADRREVSGSNARENDRYL